MREIELISSWGLSLEQVPKMSSFAADLECTAGPWTHALAAPCVRLRLILQELIPLTIHKCGSIHVVELLCRVHLTHFGERRPIFGKTVPASVCSGMHLIRHSCNNQTSHERAKPNRGDVQGGLAGSTSAQRPGFRRSGSFRATIVCFRRLRCQCNTNLTPI